MQIRSALRRRIRALCLGSALAVGAFAIGGAQGIQAQFERPDLVPTPGAWCGVTDDGGSIRIDVTDDSRFVDSISMLDTKGGSFNTEESGCAIERAQVKTGVFIFRCRGTTTSDRRTRSPGSGSRCTRAPCRGGGSRGGGGNTTATQASLIRGFVINPEAMRGNYSAFTTRTLNSVRGTRTSTKRILGNYIAWPVSAAPCP